MLSDAASLSYARGRIEYMFDDERRRASVLSDGSTEHPASEGHCQPGQSSLIEQAALVELLTLRPGGLSWPELSARILENRDITSLTDDLRSQALFPTEAESTARRHAAEQVARWRDEGLAFITILDERYPASIREIHQAPPFLFAQGTLLGDDPAVSVVGSRKASARGLAMADAIARTLVDMGVSVLSGLAEGVDTAAHLAALDAGGRTVALIGTGIRRQYPATSRELHHRIAAEGLLLSQFWPDAPPQKHTFLIRNATMSGYGMATVVVEAGEHSGARAQARMAVEHGRPVILTSSVVHGTDWGAALVGRPGVTVSKSVSDIGAAVARIRSEASRIDSVLGELVAV